MKLYLASGYESNEPGFNIGIYDSKEKAIAGIAEFKKEKSPFYYAETYTIDEYDLNSNNSTEVWAKDAD